MDVLDQTKVGEGLRINIIDSYNRDNFLEKPRPLIYQNKEEIAEIKHRKHNGLGKKIDSEIINSMRQVCVGNKVFCLEPDLSFHDFLIIYSHHVFGIHWLENELQQAEARRHPIIDWYMRMNLKIEEEVCNFPMNGAMESYLRFSYNLYLIAHNNKKLERKLVSRLQNKEQFPGAYYEIYVFAELIKAGFDLFLENERDPTTTHCECIAQHRETSQKFSIEAKAIHRKGALGVYENSTSRPIEDNIDRVLIKALKKRAEYKRIVFIDVNLPPEKSVTQTAWMTSAFNVLSEKEKSLNLGDKSAPEAYVFLTNYPSHYELDAIHNSREILTLGFKIKDYGYKKEFNSLRERYYAELKHKPVVELYNSIIKHNNIPSVFKEHLPDLEFVNDQKNPLVIGQKYNIPDDKGSNAFLINATVSISDKMIFASYCTLEDESYHLSHRMTEEEIIAYQKNPEGFFQLIEQPRRKTDNLYDLFKFYLEKYLFIPKELLLEWMKDFSDSDDLKSLTQIELAEIYCEDLALKKCINNDFIL